VNDCTLIWIIIRCVGFRNRIVAISDTLKEGIAIASVRHYDTEEKFIDANFFINKERKNG
jgi:hypothetical protein